MADEDEELEISLEGTEAEDGLETPAVEAAAEAVPKEISDDEGIEALKTAMAAKAAELAESRAAQKAAEERYAKDVGSRESEILDGHISVLTARRDAINARVVHLKRDYADAGRSGDYDKQADIQAEMAGLGAQFHEVSQGLYNLDQRKRNPPKPSTPETAPKTAAEQGLSSKSQKWVNDHRDVIANPRMYNKMISGHHDALAEGLSIDSPEYFDHVEKFMGLKKEEAAAPPPPRKVQSAAPPSKAPLSNPTKVTVKLTKEEHEWCKELGQKPEVYAREKAKLIRAGRISN